MIEVFVNEKGYLIYGPALKGWPVVVVRRCYRASIFQPIHHTYKVLYLALKELINLSLKTDIMIYNDSRIIDELNGLVEPLDHVCQKWKNILKRHTLYEIKSLVFFRKKNSEFIEDKLQEAFQTYLVKDLQLKLPSTKIKNKNKQITNFKQRWLYDRY